MSPGPAGSRWHTVAQHGYVALGRATYRLRMRPSFIMVGASRSGTTSLFRALSEHPQVVRPAVNKGVRYFDLNSFRPQSWYFGHFPVEVAGRRTRSGVPVTFEASGYYVFHPFAAERMARLLPDVRLVLMVRDPVERAYSAWKHESARGFEWEGFERALELEDARLRGEVERMAVDPTYESFAHRHLSHSHRGEYAEQLERIYAHYPREQVHVMESERFFRDPAAEYARLLDFLRLPVVMPQRFDQHNARPSSGMPQEARAQLQAHYRDHDERLADLLGYRPGWMV